jgi:RNA polymerase sigma-70 factor, ECF subfamily
MGIFREDILEVVPHLRAFARSLTGGDVHFADDLVQDTVVNALQAQSQFEEGSNLKAWLFTILRNRFRSVIARKHVKSEIGDEDLERLSVVPAYQESKLEVMAFKQAFKQLSPAHREVLVLAVIQGYSYDKIAELCGCEVGTVKSRVNRARNLLKKMLVGDEHEVAPVADERPARERGARLRTTGHDPDRVESAHFLS